MINYPGYGIPLRLKADRSRNDHGTHIRVIERLILPDLLPGLGVQDSPRPPAVALLLDPVPHRTTGVGARW